MNNTNDTKLGDLDAVMSISNITQLGDLDNVKPKQRDKLKAQHACNLMASTCILMKKSTHLIGITSKDDVVFIVNNAYANWKPKAGSTDILVHVSFPNMYPHYAKLYFNPATLDHLTNRFDDCYIPSPTSVPGSAPTSMSTDMSSLFTAIKNSVDCF